LIILRSAREIEKIRKACLIVAEILEQLREHIQPGVTTWDLNVLSEELATKKGKQSRPSRDTTDSLMPCAPR